MAISHEKAATALGAALAAGALAVAADAKTHQHETAPKRHVSAMEQDHLAHIALMSRDVTVILRREAQEEKRLTLHLPHHGPSHSSTHAMDLHATLIPESQSLRNWEHMLGKCESGNNYSENTGNGFEGYYQFEQSEWDSVAEKTDHQKLAGVPVYEATPDEQDTMIILNTVLAKDGLRSQNPGCYATWESSGLSVQPPGISASEISALEHGGYLKHSEA